MIEKIDAACEHLLTVRPKKDFDVMVKTSALFGYHRRHRHQFINQRLGIAQLNDIAAETKQKAKNFYFLIFFLPI